MCETKIVCMFYFTRNVEINFNKVYKQNNSINDFELGIQCGNIIYLNSLCVVLFGQ